MPPDLTIDPSQATTEQSVPPPSSTPDPSKDAPQETMEELKEKLAAAESEAKRMKGRLEKARVGKESVSEDDMNWAINHNPRVALVKEAYDKELTELEALGAKVTNATKTKALENAERITGIAKATVSTPDTSFPSPSVDRSASAQVRMTDFDRQLKVKPETVKEYRDYVEGR